jgi:cobalt-zinc-cadmium efflux system protein
MSQHRHDHSHSGHGHCHHHGDYNRAFAIGVTLNVVYVVVEGTFGFMTGSLALLADAGHNLSDVLGLLLAWSGHYLSRLKPTPRRTYGWRSSSILAALFNALLLLVAVGGITWEAVQRIAEPANVPGTTVMLVAGIGVLINAATAYLFMSGSKDDLNIRGAYLHMAADAGVSVAVVFGGLLMVTLGWNWADPVLSLIIAAVILIGTWSMLRESLNLTLHAVPTGIDPAQVQGYLATLPEVDSVHDLHIWAMSTTENALTAHLVILEREDEGFLHRVAAALREQFKIHHPTIQIERSAEGCLLAPPEHV